MPQLFQFNELTTIRGIDTPTQATDSANKAYVDAQIGGAGVTQIVAGTNVTISPATGTGVVTINSTASGSGTAPQLFNLGQSLLASQSGPLVKVTSATASATRDVTINTGGPGFGAVTFNLSVNPAVGNSQFVGVSDPTNAAWGGIGRLNQQLNGLDIIAWIIAPPAGTTTVANCNVWFLINATASLPIAGTLQDAQDSGTSSALVFPSSEASLTFISDNFGQQAVSVAIPRVRSLNGTDGAVTLTSSDSSVNITPSIEAKTIDLRVAFSSGAGTVIAVNNVETNYANLSYLLNGSATTPQNGSFAAQIGAGSGVSSNPLALAPLSLGQGNGTGGWSFKLGSTTANAFTAELGGQVQTVRVKAAGIWNNNITKLASPIFIQRNYTTNDDNTHEFPGFENAFTGYEFLAPLTPESYSQRYSRNLGNNITGFTDFQYSSVDDSYHIKFLSDTAWPTTLAQYPFCTVPLFVTFNGTTTYLGSEWQVVGGLGTNNGLEVKLTATNSTMSPTGFDIEFYQTTVAGSTAGFSLATVGANTFGGAPFTADDRLAIIWDYGLPNLPNPQNFEGFFEITFQPNSWYRSSTELNPTGFTLPSSANQDFLFSWIGYLPSGMVTQTNGVRLFHSLNDVSLQDRYNTRGTWNNRLTLSYGGQALPFATTQYYAGYTKVAGTYASGSLSVRTIDGYNADPTVFRANDKLSFGNIGSTQQCTIISAVVGVTPDVLNLTVSASQPDYAVGLNAIIQPAGSFLMEYPFKATDEGVGLNTSPLLVLDSGNPETGDRLALFSTASWSTFIMFPYVTKTNITGGKVITYTVPPALQGGRFNGQTLGAQVYRRVPSPYTYPNDGFFNVFDGTAVSGPLNITRSI